VPNVGRVMRTATLMFVLSLVWLAILIIGIPLILSLWLAHPLCVFAPSETTRSSDRCHRQALDCLSENPV
jgi:hypothetical protein